MELCFHCGDPCKETAIVAQDKHFCCHGCKTVYDILNDNDLSHYYNLETRPGISPSRFDGKFDFLENDSIVEKLLDFNENNVQVVTFTIPSIHCSSCIWVLENLHKIEPAVQSVQVNFPKKTARITYAANELKLLDVVVLLSKIGYEPYISLEDATKEDARIDRSLIYKLGVAGFAFGNIMFLSFPEYFEVHDFWLDRFKHLFRWLMFGFSLPVVLYSGQDYLISAFKSLRAKMLNIDIPIALGIIVLFARSTLEIAMDWGTGFFDSLSGLVFFLLLGKFFQQKTYSFLSFERDYKSYFPIAVTRLRKLTSEGNTSIKEEQAQINELAPGDRILIRNEELIPVDGILINGNALIDYSFVTGEAEPVTKQSGDTLYAGGRQQAGIIEVEVIASVAQSYLTQLWANDVFSKRHTTFYKGITNTVSKHFTISLLAIAIIATTFWLYYEPSLALNVFTAVLIVACPCAIALAAPFTLGNMLRIFGRHKLYAKNSAVIEQLAEVDTVVFDKTGTLTTTKKSVITYEGIALTSEEERLLTATLRASNHPLSRSLYDMLQVNDIYTLDEFTEEVGQGITGRKEYNQVKVGGYDFVAKNLPQHEAPLSSNRTSVHISTNKQYKGCYVFYHEYRTGVQAVFDALSPSNELVVLSGDNDGEKAYLSKLLPKKTRFAFNQKPEDKLVFIKRLQQDGKKVLMVGDGLNDAGALAQSDVGIVISENINVFSPACDGILDAARFNDLPRFIQLSEKARAVIKYAFLFSLLYNLIGLGFAVIGHLKPVIAAVLMPLSSISIVVFTTLYTYVLGRQLQTKGTRQSSVR
ncbi:heavy metal translocating P-type ATPase [Altibacter sp. HG106]|uniref:heavy metal translocating P-type ATPase n=1 Tax=Altibacter sp. HG106 TaxID=3023937 RepID=UPI002350AF15|nr:heavy metal translocating P-type ATPase metal-binding domain-containing protein [Altibacter sp. HG106]MDC7994330.1 heavy metal translocating P-type ATPase metal-binding domain-containing protein [Altibacter sp. HG106]